ncbi:MAG: hypothetical protein ABI425_03655 [Patescibacteria group bacterium]
MYKFRSLLVLVAMVAMTLVTTVSARDGANSTPTPDGSKVVDGTTLSTTETWPELAGEWVITYNVNIRNFADPESNDAGDLNVGDVIKLVEIVVVPEGQVWGLGASGLYVQLWDGESREWNAQPTTLPTLDVDGQVLVFDFASYFEALATAETNDPVGESLGWLNTRFDLKSGQGNFPGSVGGWNKGDNVTIVGPAIFWTDFHKGSNVPANAERVAVSGQWGVWSVAPGLSISFDAVDGGRWVALTYVQTPEMLGQGGGSACAEFNVLVTDIAGLSPEDAVQFMDAFKGENSTHDSRYLSNDDSTVTITDTQIAVFWRDWGSKGAPQGVSPLTIDSTAGGYGVWQAMGPLTLNGVNNGGVVIFSCNG